MDGSKSAVFTLILVLFAFSAVSLSFKVQVDALTDHTVRGLDYKENITSTQEINATIENMGSIGCQYRLKAIINKGNNTIERYSDKHPIWPGSSAFAEIHYVPLNHTGSSSVRLQIQYCGRTKNITQFQYTDTVNTTVNTSLSTQVKTLDSNSVEVKTGVKEGLLIPHKVPPYWKASAVKIKNNEAVAEFEPSIFKQGETLTYLAVNQSSGEIYGRTKVHLTEPSPTLKEKVMKKKFQIILTVLLVSLTGNLILIHEKKTKE